MSPYPSAGARGERGAALITAALTLLIIAVLVVTFMTTVTSERAMSSNVQVARGSLYAADAGVRTAQRAMSDVATVQLNALAATYDGSGPVIDSPTSFFPSPTMVVNSTNPRFATTTTISFQNSAIAADSQTYNYRYSIVSKGDLGAHGTRSIQSDGVLRVSAVRGNFTNFLLFTDIHTTGSGGAVWFTSSGHFDGRVHTNTMFRFAYRPTFEDLITSTSGVGEYYNNNQPIQLNDDHNGTLDVPNLYGGYNRNQPRIDLPTNSFGQHNASLGRDPSNTTSPTNTEIRQALGLTGTSAPPNGIYLPTTGSSPSWPPAAGAQVKGGIYVHGDLSTCRISVDSLGRQVYRMTQGATTRIITVNKSVTPPVTMISDGGTTYTMEGAPRGVIYAKGTIADIGGPDRSGDGTIPPALADGTELLVAATNDIVIQRDITYHDYQDGGSVLGIFSSGGDVRVGTSAPNDMNLDAYIMAAGSNGEFRVDNYDQGTPRGTLHLRGGMVSTYYGLFYRFDSNGHLIHGYGRDFRYDRRGLSPPYYPTTNQFAPNAPVARTIGWKEL